MGIQARVRSRRRKMIRRVVFEHGDRDFDNIWTGVLLAVAEATSKAVDKAEGRIEQKVVRKLESISDVKMVDGRPVLFPTQEEQRVIKPGVQIIDFEQSELSLIIERMERVRWFATKRASALDTVDWLDSSEKDPTTSLEEARAAHVREYPALVK
jgi:hypothetical protein